MPEKNDDLLAQISRPTTAVVQSFLRRAFSPSSVNPNPERTDVLLERIKIFRGKGKKARVLDLGCGDCLLFQKLLADHGKGTPCLGEVSYVAVDLRRRDKAWEQLVETARGIVCCFGEPELVPMGFDSPGQLRKRFREEEFTTIVLANVLHECAPEHLPDLLIDLRGLLAENGEIVILDLGRDWTFADGAWLSVPGPRNGKKPKLPSLATVRADWEMDAWWINLETICKCLVAAGFDVVDGLPIERPSGTMWLAIGKTAAREPDRAGVVAALRYALQPTLLPYQRFKERVRKALDPSRDFGPREHVDVARLFCYAASEVRKLEALEALRP